VIEGRSAAKRIGYEGTAMGEIRVQSELTVDARQAALFKLVADYDGRPRYLPPSFEDWRVEQGGLGGGTVVTYRLRTGRRERAYRIAVEEETVGSVLVERDAGSSLATTWTLVPDGRDRTVVRITTTWKGAGGIGGLFERQFAPPALRRVHGDLLARLARLAAELLPPPEPEPVVERRRAPAAPERVAGFHGDLTEPVGPAARRARARRDGDGGQSSEG
jgi:hypothetical protein